MPNHIHTIVVFPWLNISNEPIEFLGFSFVPYYKESKNVHSPLGSIRPQINKFLRSHYKLKKESLGYCVLACPVNGNSLNWNIKDSDIPNVRKAALFLYLCAISNNDYFTQFGNYTNSSYFKYFFQNIQYPTPDSENQDYVSFELRTRFGKQSLMGYKSSEIVLSAPLQCLNDRPIKVDLLLLKAIQEVRLRNPRLFEQIFSSLKYFSMSNIDDEFLDSEADVIFMAASFEMLLKTTECYVLTKRLGNLFKDYGKVTVNEARKFRPGIEIKKDSVVEGKWFIHRKWIQEFHNLRSTLVHGESLSKRTWGWTIFEHLLIGSLIYPLVVKLILQQNEFYQLNRDDETDCFTIDRLLAVNNWHKENKGRRSNASEAYTQAGCVKFQGVKVTGA
jgi:hypothetical protein